MRDRVSDAQWSQLSEFIARTTGLHFPRERSADLQRGVAGAARELGFEDTAACVDRLLSVPPTAAEIGILASHLTVGETYFFREKKTFDVLSADILPELIRSRRGRGQRLRFWSAACCTGEEPYSLAILLHQALPDLEEWHVTIAATDINGRFLRRAAAGTYGEWSFRDMPAWFKERYFNRTMDGRYTILPEIRRLVTFVQLNLVEDVYPSLATETNAMDVILCRNALMYFTPSQVRNVIRNLHHALAEDGWLVVSPSEASHALFPQFTTVNFPGVILYRKSGAKLRMKQPWLPAPLDDAADMVAPAIDPSSPWAPRIPVAPPMEPAPARPVEEPARPETPPSPCAVAETLYQEGRYAEAADILLASIDRHAHEPAAFSLLARALANQGELTDALAWCDRWIAADKLDPAAHYLHAVVFVERGDIERARSSLQRALYLQPDFVLAHFTLGNLARRRGKSEDADKHFANALDLLRRYQPGDQVPEADGLTAGRLTETITAVTGMETVP
ncbi:MAG: tetratricopeptide repeat protein [Betaproteobacteria bacterium]|nr:tetratricopeptide repeat protein [Betaproteobacteria bacterium]